MKKSTFFIVCALAVVVILVVTMPDAFAGGAPEDRALSILERILHMFQDFFGGLIDRVVIGIKDIFSSGK